MVYSRYRAGYTEGICWTAFSLVYQCAHFTLGGSQFYQHYPKLSCDDNLNTAEPDSVNKKSKIV
jgi:hypothetical protein